MDRRLFIVIAVVGFHVLGLWALQTGLLRRAVELVVPVQVMAEFIELPQPQVMPEPTQPRPLPVLKPVAPTKPAPKPAPQPVAIADPIPTPDAPAGITTPQPPAPLVLTPVPVAEPAPPAPPKTVLPSTSAAYLNNPKPLYPPLSKRLREQGNVLIQALIKVDGTVGQAQIYSSSGFARLDQSALEAVRRWKFVPGTVDGVAKPLSVNVPIVFELND